MLLKKDSSAVAIQKAQKHKAKWNCREAASKDRTVGMGTIGQIWATFEEEEPKQFQHPSECNRVKGFNFTNYHERWQNKGSDIQLLSLPYSLNSSRPKLATAPSRECSCLQAFAPAIPTTCYLQNAVNSFFPCSPFSEKPVLTTTETGTYSPRVSVTRSAHLC